MPYLLHILQDAGVNMPYQPQRRAIFFCPKHVAVFSCRRHVLQCVTAHSYKISALT